MTKNGSSKTDMNKKLRLLIASPCLLMLVNISHADVVELSPNELNSAYIEDSTIYIPKSTQEKIGKKIVNVKFTPGKGDPDQVDRESELDEQAEQAAIASFQANQSWESTRTETALINATQTSFQSDPALLPPREIIGAPEGFTLPENFSYTVQDLQNLGFTDPTTGQPLSLVSDSGIFYGDNLQVGTDGTNGFIQIPIVNPADFESGLPAGGVNSDILSINQALQNAINIRLQLPKN